MWPKAFAQFLEIAPHIGRLLPLADRFLQSRASGDEATRAAVTQLNTTTEGLRGDLGAVNTAHATLTRMITEQAERTAALSATVEAQARSSRELTERLQTELTGSSTALQRAEARIGHLQTLLLVNMALLLVAVAVVIAMYVHLK